MYPKSIFLLSFVVKTSIYSWQKLVFENFFGKCKFYAIFLINIIVVIIETQVRCHWLSMVS